jgi:hypothetical protein
MVESGAWRDVGAAGNLLHAGGPNATLAVERGGSVDDGVSGNSDLLGPSLHRVSPR